MFLAEKKQKSRSENRGGFPLLSTPFQDRQPGGRLILMFNLPFVKDLYANTSNFFQEQPKKRSSCLIMQMLQIFFI